MTTADRLLLLGVCILLPFLYIEFWFNDHAARYLLLHSDSTEPRTESLEPNRILKIAGPLGESRIEIRDGHARFLASPCPTQACVHSGWLSRSGEFTACLPNHVSLELASNHPYYDTINF